MTDAVDLTVIQVDRPADLPAGRLLDAMPETGTVHVYHAPTPIAGGPWKIIIEADEGKGAQTDGDHVQTLGSIDGCASGLSLSADRSELSCAVCARR